MNLITRLCLIAIGFSCAYVATMFLNLHGLTTRHRDFWVIVVSAGLGSLLSFWGAHGGCPKKPK